MTPRDKVEKWFVAPLRVLRDAKSGDEGFLVLMVGISLAERIVSSKRKRDKGVGVDRTAEQCGSDFLNIPLDTYSAFWSMYRNGLMHHAHPFSGKFLQGDNTFWDWDISDSYSSIPEIVETEPTKRVIRISPWKWLEYVLSKYDSYPELIDLGDSRKLGDVGSVPEIARSALHNTLPDHPPSRLKVDLRTGSATG
jgi:hypothetical protein